VKPAGIRRASQPGYAGDDGRAAPAMRFIEDLTSAPERVFPADSGREIP
jgi:hypothetical protein